MINPWPTTICICVLCRGDLLLRRNVRASVPGSHLRNECSPLYRGMEGGLQGPGGQLPGSGLLPATRHTSSVNVSGGSERTIDCSSADQVRFSSTLYSLLVYLFLNISLRFIDVPIESCGKASPLRVALQASAPDILLILLRYEILRDNCTTTMKQQTFDKQKHPLIELIYPPSADSVPILCHRTMALT